MVDPEPGWTEAENIIANHLHPGTHAWFAALHEARGIIAALEVAGFAVAQRREQSFSDRVTAARASHHLTDPNPAVEHSKRMGGLFDPPDGET